MSCLRTARTAPNAFWPSCRNTSKPSRIFSVTMAGLLIEAGNGTVLGRAAVRPVEHNFRHIAPAPAFGRIIALDDGMFGAVEMLGGVLVLGLVTAADMAAGAADAQVKPGIALLQAFLAAQRAGRHVLDAAEMGTAVRHGHSA